MQWVYTIERGDTYYSLLSDLGMVERIKVKRWMRNNADSLPELTPGTVSFSGSYTMEEWIKTITQSTRDSQTARVTFFEWWSSYDIDAKLTSLWLIQAGQYRQAITDNIVVQKYVSLYPWLAKQGGSLTSLEWYLYPDTYFIDSGKPVIEQVITMQLKAYQDKVWAIHGDAMLQFSQKIASDGYAITMSPYAMMKLASVIENEEKATKNKPIIAGIFLNRLKDGMRLDADITVCYGKWVTYDACTPAYIVQHLYEDTNPYNTRKVSWLPPTPISNPSVVTIQWLLNYIKSDYVFYLHDAKGVIYPAKTIEEHNENKAQYLSS